MWILKERLADLDTVCILPCIAEFPVLKFISRKLLRKLLYAKHGIYVCILKCLKRNLRVSIDTHEFIAPQYPA